MGWKERIQPWWLDGPCPSWCTHPHDEDGLIEAAYKPAERVHHGDYIGGDDLYLSMAEPLPVPDSNHSEIRRVAVQVEQAFREVEPHVALVFDDDDGLPLTLSEARALRDRLTEAIRQAEGGAA